MSEYKFTVNEVDEIFLGDILPPGKLDALSEKEVFECIGGVNVNAWPTALEKIAGAYSARSRKRIIQLPLLLVFVEILFAISREGAPAWLIPILAYSNTAAHVLVAIATLVVAVGFFIAMGANHKYLQAARLFRATLVESKGQFNLTEAELRSLLAVLLGVSLIEIVRQEQPSQVSRHSI